MSEVLASDRPLSVESGNVASQSLERARQLPRELVEHFRICWEVWPEYIIAGHEKRQIGFALDLSGTHPPGVDHPSPACGYCQEVFAALQVIAGHILPRETRDSAYRIEPYDQAIHYSRSRKDRPDVTLTIRILRREGFERPVDECEVRCLAEMKRRLTELGACEGQWIQRKGSHP